MDRVVEMPIMLPKFGADLSGLEALLAGLGKSNKTNYVAALYIIITSCAGLRSLRRMLSSPIRSMAKAYQIAWLSLFQAPLTALARIETEALATEGVTSLQKLARTLQIGGARSLRLFLPAGSSAILGALAVLAGSSTLATSTIAIALASYFLHQASRTSSIISGGASVLLTGPIIAAGYFGKQKSLRRYIQFLLVTCARYLVSDGTWSLTQLDGASRGEAAVAFLASVLSMGAFLRSTCYTKRLMDYFNTSADFNRVVFSSTQ